MTGVATSGHVVKKMTVENVKVLRASHPQAVNFSIFEAVSMFFLPFFVKPLPAPSPSLSLSLLSISIALIQFCVAFVPVLAIMRSV